MNHCTQHPMATPEVGREQTKNHHTKDAAMPKSGVHEFGQFGKKVELLSFPTVVSDCKSDRY